ncbi:MAG: hypothetical protein GX896_08100 [Clostridiales bacterium]|nr:hypothetical protein [Clostridiales bacterium]
MNLYDDKNAHNDIEAVLENMTRLVENKELEQILGNEFVKELVDWDATITKRCNEPFTIVILGEFKRGKSTIINALLGKELAPTNVSPETYTINEISYGETQKIEAVLENGQRIPLDISEITREKLEIKMRLFPAKISYIDIRDNSPFLKEMKIVDTPGLSDLDDLDKQVTEYLINADAIMYATSSLLPFSETEQVFLASHVQPQRFGMLYVLVNMIDALNSQRDVNKIMNRFTRMLEQTVPNAFIYGISGADELRRKLGTTRLQDKGTRDFYEAQFFKFELSLKRDLIMQKDVIRTKRVLTMLDQMVNETTAKINMFADMAEMDQKKLEEKTLDFNEKCSQLASALEERKPTLHLYITEMQQEAEIWMYEFFAKLRLSMLECRQVDEIGEPIYSADDIGKYFYSYLMEKVGEAYRRCIEYHRDKVNEIVEYMSRDLAKKLGLQDLSSVTQATSVDRIMMSLNKNVTRSVMGVKLFGTSETFPPTTMSVFSKILKRKKTTDIIDIALENYDDIRSNIVKDIKKVYQDLEVKSCQRLDSIYQYQTEVGKETLSQAREMLNIFDNKTIGITLAKANLYLRKSARVLEKYDFD